MVLLKIRRIIIMCVKIINKLVEIHLKNKYDYDKDYITNSYHIPVFEEIDPFEKIKIESKF